MKYLFLALCLFALSGHTQTVRKVPIEYAQVFVEGDSVVLKVRGYLPNACYSSPRLEAEGLKLAGNPEVFVDVVSFKSDNICAEVIRPYTLLARLGPFPAGANTIVLQEGTRWESLLDFYIDGLD